MSTLNVRREYADGDILLQSDLDAFLDDIETFLNTTKINDDNIQNNGITGSTKLANASVTVAKMAANSVGTTQLTANAVTNVKMADNSVDTVELVADAVTTAKILDANVTQAKLADRTVTTDGSDPGAGGISQSTAQASFTTDSVTFVDVTSLSTILTTTGRPVLIGMIGDGGSESYLEGKTSTSNFRIATKFVRDGSTDVAQMRMEQQGVTNGFQTIPLSSYWTIDDVASGTYTYKVQVKTNSAAAEDVTFVNARLIAYEL